VAPSHFRFFSRKTRTKKQGFSQRPERRGRGFSDIPRMGASGVANEAIQWRFFVGDFRDGSLCDTIHGSDTPSIDLKSISQQQNDAIDTTLRQDIAFKTYQIV
jgi:hypothetical protein